MFELDFFIMFLIASQDNLINKRNSWEETLIDKVLFEKKYISEKLLHSVLSYNNLNQI